LQYYYSFRQTGVSEEFAPIPIFLLVLVIHHSLNKLQVRSKFGIIIRSAEPREPHHFALDMEQVLCPCLSMKLLRSSYSRFYHDVNADYAITNYNKTIAKVF
jgi:glutamate synthase (ferredoxin)